MSTFVVDENGDVRNFFSRKLITNTTIAEMVKAFAQKGKYEEISESDCWFIIDNRKSVEENVV
ncbi:MAG: hypothetical protein AAB842_02965 [Patescibacteria group bacterium]